MKDERTKERKTDDKKKRRVQNKRAIEGVWVNKSMSRLCVVMQTDVLVFVDQMNKSSNKIEGINKSLIKPAT